MAEIKPFRGVRYDIDRVGDMAQVVAPPYDVIDEALQRSLHEAHPNNVVRLIRSLDAPGDSDGHNRYTRAAAAYSGWRNEGILRRDAEESLYLYAQEFEAATPAGPVRKSRLGIVVLVRAEPFGRGQVLPHEHTMPAPKADRLALMRHTRAAFGQIFSLYSDPAGAVRARLQADLEAPALFSFSDPEGVIHRLWRVTDRSCVDDVTAQLASRPLFIADGHHRYETAVAYGEERAASEAADAGNRPYGYCMQTLVNMDDAEGMAINPIHRVVSDLGEAGVRKLRSGLRTFFDVESRPFSDVVEIRRELSRRRGHGRPVFGFVSEGDREVHYLRLKPSVDVAALDRDEHSKAWHGLGSGLLQLILGQVLQLDAETLTRGERVRFVKVESEVLRLLREAPGRAAFFLNPVEMDQLRDVVLSGERMPPKSTFFYPKVYSGLVMQDLQSF